MRHSLLALAALAVGGLVSAATPAAARDYLYCTDSRIEGTRCAYDSYSQCQASASGLGISCIVNPRVAFGAAPAYAEPPRHKRRYYSAPRG